MKNKVETTSQRTDSMSAAESETIKSKTADFLKAGGKIQVIKNHVTARATSPHFMETQWIDNKG
jgi:hypothetical protein